MREDCARATPDRPRALVFPRRRQWGAEDFARFEFFVRGARVEREARVESLADAGAMDVDGDVFATVEGRFEQRNDNEAAQWRRAPQADGL